MKIIIYALGELYQKVKQEIDWQEVAGLSDKKRAGETEHGSVILHPCKLYEVEYDYIVIFSQRYYKQIKKELNGEFAVPERKILSFHHYLDSEALHAYHDLQLIKQYASEVKCQKLLDAEGQILTKQVLTMEEVISGKEGELDYLNVNGTKNYINKSLYGSCFHNPKEISNTYDIAWIDGAKLLESSDLSKSRDVLEDLLKVAGRILISVTFRQDHAIEELVQSKQSRRYLTETAICWELTSREQPKIEHCTIYTVLHKEYHVLQNDLYSPLTVGGFEKEGYLRETSGEHIAYLNSKINECSALYWIWKNTESQFVGLNHYRRYFYNNQIQCDENRLDASTLERLMMESDLLLTEAAELNGFSELQQIKDSIDDQAFKTGYQLMEDGIRRHQPSYLEDFYSVMNGSTMFACNMFVTRREVLDAYCTWLFSFLIEVAEHAEVAQYDPYSQRVIGFFAERLWTVWLRKQKLKIKALPYDIIN
ncbi:MAG: DUF4422 domain-containing protein [Lachnospiraceae bacterium]